MTGTSPAPGGFPRQDTAPRPGSGTEPVRFGIVGHGWRADFYHRLARQLPDRFRCVGAVTRTAEAGARLERSWDIPTYRRPEELVTRAAPEVVVTSVPREANPDVIRALASTGTAVLSETPPAPDAEGLRRLWADVGAENLVQVAEQHPFLPFFVALSVLVDDGVLGQVTSAHVSWTHDYHATAILRSLLGLGADPVRITAIRTRSPLLEGPDRSGRPARPQVRETAHTVALLQSGDLSGGYDFTDGQWFNPLRRRHLVLRGSHGEVVGNQVNWCGDDGTVLSAPIVRHQTGFDGNLEGSDLDTLTWAGRVLYRNPYPGARLSDEEIAIATCLERTAHWRRGTCSAPYPLAEGCQDHLLALGIHAAADHGEPVTTAAEPWAAAPGRRGAPA